MAISYFYRDDKRGEKQDYDEGSGKLAAETTVDRRKKMKITQDTEFRVDFSNEGWDNDSILYPYIIQIYADGALLYQEKTKYDCLDCQTDAFFTAVGIFLDVSKSDLNIKYGEIK